MEFLASRSGLHAQIYIWWKKMRRNTRDILEVLVNNIEKDIDVNIEKSEKLE